MDNYVVISGCSGGGKSTLLEELAARGFSTVQEPGRRIIAQEIALGGAALPWVDLAAFARRAVEMALSDRREATRLTGPVFFDRGLIDAAAALEYAAGRPAASEICREHRYHRRAFLVPAWPEIYRSDAERKHGLAEAMAEYERLLTTYRQLGYEVVIIPKMAVADRADFVIGHFRPGSLPHP